MTRLRIDDPQIDLEAIEARVEAAIERKRGKRFSDAELEELRNTPLRPRLRREDLPRGLVGELSQVRGRLPAIAPPPAPKPADIAATRDSSFDRHPGPSDLIAALYAVQRGGIRGRVQGWIRRAMRRFYRATLNLDHVVAELADRDDRYLDYIEGRLERSLDVLKDNLDQCLDRTADWTGAHVSSMTGQLEERHERQLHLLHNLVYELSNARLDLKHMQDRLNEMSRRMVMLEDRGRALEGLALPLESGQTRGPAGVGGRPGSRHARSGPGDPDLPR